MAVFTTTTHATHIPDQWPDETRMAVEATLVLAKLVKKVTFDKAIKGDVIHIPDVSNITAADMPTDGTDIVASAPTEGEFTLTINKWKHVSIQVPKNLALYLMKYEVRKEYTPKIGYGLGKIVDDDLFALGMGLSQSSGTTADGLEGNISDSIILKAIEQLDLGDIDQADRAIILNARQKAKMLAIDKFVRADAVGDSNQAIVKAQFGEIYGMPVYFTTQTPVKLAATAPATAVDSHINLIFQMEAFALAMPQDVNIDYDFIPMKKNFLLSGDIVYGVAEFRDLAGVKTFTKQTG